MKRFQFTIATFLASSLFLSSSIAIADERYDKLLEQLELFQQSPCESTLILEKSFDSWNITCENCAAISTDNILPQTTIEIAEQQSVNNRISFTELGRLNGNCE